MKKLLYMLVFLAVPALAGPYSGQGLRDHGHTGPGDGGVLSNPSVTGGSSTWTYVNSSNANFSNGSSTWTYVKSSNANFSNGSSTWTYLSAGNFSVTGGTTSFSSYTHVFVIKGPGEIQSIQSNVSPIDLMTATTTITDTLGEWSTDTFTALYPGYYHICANALWAQASGGFRVGLIASTPVGAVLSTAEAMDAHPGFATVDTTSHSCATVHLPAGGKLGFYLGQNTGSPVLIIGSNAAVSQRACRITIDRIP